MTFTIVVKRLNGQFAAQLVGEADSEVVRPTRDEALAAMTAELQDRVECGELVSVDLPRRGAAGIAGTCADDPTLQELCDEIYAARDRDRDEMAE